LRLSLLLLLRLSLLLLLLLLLSSFAEDGGSAFAVAFASALASAFCPCCSFRCLTLEAGFQPGATKAAFPKLFLAFFPAKIACQASKPLNPLPINNIRLAYEFHPTRYNRIRIKKNPGPSQGFAFNRQKKPLIPSHGIFWKKPACYQYFTDQHTP